MKNFKSESKEIKKQQQQQNSGYSRKSTQGREETWIPRD